MPVKRYDSAPLGKACKTDAGFLKAPAYLTRVGVFEYRDGAGKIYRELRLPEEVFSQDSLDTFQLAPLTNNHPTADDGRVTSKNAGLLQVGTVGQDVHQDGDFVAATVVVTDGKTIAQIESGKVELSCGYFCDSDPTPGVWLDSNGVTHKYDAVQRNIRGNHVAVVNVGRAGKQVRLLLDSNDAMRVESDKQETGQAATEDFKPMEKLTIDSVEVELSATAKAIVQKALDLAAQAATEAKANLDKLTARADAAEATSAENAKALAAASAPERIQELVKARVALEAKASAAGVKADGLSDEEVRRQVVAKLSPGLALDGKSNDYVAAAFDAVLASSAANNPAGKQLAEKIGNGGTTRSDSLTPRQKFEAEFFGRKTTKEQ